MDTLANCPDEIFATAQELITLSSPITETYFHTPPAIDYKQDDSPVTVADRKIEEVIREVIKERHPDHGIYGEEFGRHNPDADIQWIIDPIDGTKAFMTGLACFGTLIGVMQNDRFIYGACHNPITGQTWQGAIGHPTTLNGETIKSVSGREKSRWITAMVNPLRASGAHRNVIDALYNEGGFLSLNGHCLNQCHLAEGRVDCVITIRYDLYDIAALAPIVTGAGGIIETFSGEPFTAQTSEPIISYADPAVGEFVKARFLQG